MPVSWMLLLVIVLVFVILAIGAGGLVHDISHAIGGTR